MRLGASNLIGGLFTAAFLFGTVDYFHFLRPVTCDDCHFPYGRPFTFSQAGGFAGDSGIVWRGVIGDLLVIVVCGFVFALAMAALKKEQVPR